MPRELFTRTLARRITDLLLQTSQMLLVCFMALACASVRSTPVQHVQPEPARVKRSIDQALLGVQHNLSPWVDLESNTIVVDSVAQHYCREVVVTEVYYEHRQGGRFDGSGTRGAFWNGVFAAAALGTGIYLASSGDYEPTVRNWGGGSLIAMGVGSFGWLIGCGVYTLETKVGEHWDSSSDDTTTVVECGQLNDSRPKSISAAALDSSGHELKLLQLDCTGNAAQFRCAIPCDNLIARKVGDAETWVLRSTPSIATTYQLTVPNDRSRVELQLPAAVVEKCWQRELMANDFERAVMTYRHGPRALTLAAEKKAIEIAVADVRSLADAKRFFVRCAADGLSCAGEAMNSVLAVVEASWSSNPRQYRALCQEWTLPCQNNKSAEALVLTVDGADLSTLREFEIWCVSVSCHREHLSRVKSAIDKEEKRIEQERQARRKEITKLKDTDKLYSLYLSEKDPEFRELAKSTARRLNSNSKTDTVLRKAAALIDNTQWSQTKVYFCDFKAGELTYVLNLTPIGGIALIMDGEAAIDRFTNVVEAFNRFLVSEISEVKRASQVHRCNRNRWYD